ncbi:MAG: phenylalanine--tRNA ligase subunit alpha [Deltaproteobacteria bacterium GWA2_42_85]|nr:MAG: phenylalanine--tRNA ligase subunit alpha [Deltaproteobacteria bacterium GWA2_42_85]OGQ26364.1 MAG: phenylalanine--tRNA ligase subunit alpha [Deltaproteobacteria bacterium RIFCSPHIGHO2_02_FULL_42_44]OGQ35851.1 MAG: phenylalanine--tRNA ligase subunit alpha [Deltaproteobacteria bacterium RIFCSPLOWO2_02_FULL_42_39]OGQ67428.1 MAG: phenylalanine--tRNA ligase subunit alpha [Deltaproteobacteria bacterium RIFCSPLOWO2_12_FULL_42_16]OGQ74634.1 MAG: phenylalanine--tRNA ligase subunit alpha [Deltapr
MKDRLLQLEKAALSEISSIKSKEAIVEFKNKYLGRKGELASLFRELGGFPPEERPVIGELINTIRGRIEARVNSLITVFAQDERIQRLKAEKVDVTLPGRYLPSGKRHPITQIMNDVKRIFLGMGFTVAEGPEVETDYYNFEALNIPKDHPARDMQDTFYISDDILLRTHTSPVQIRVMQSQKPPLRVIVPGKVYRRDSDITHTPMFHQVEGFMVDEHITFGNLKGVLSAFLHSLFGEDIAVRFRPSFFPFTEPSAEVDIQCVICNGKGCRVCKNSGWLEILGSGMIHPMVFKAVGYDSERFTGFAFGMGIERIAMLKFGIDDIRLFFENDVRFLRQF